MMEDKKMAMECATCGEPVEAFNSDVRRLRSLGAPEDRYCSTACWLASRACSQFCRCPETHYDDDDAA